MRTKTCPVCDAENTINALVCINCGATFSSGDTLQVSIVPPEPVQHAQIEQIARTYGDSIVIFVEGSDQPIVVPKKVGKITIGRTVAGHEAPTVDLMEYGGSMHGVSRMHASIYTSDHGFMVQDMDSTNGTWLNGTRLMPHAPSSIHNGDRLRLGEMALFVYFSSQQNEGEQTLLLFDPVIGQSGMTPVYLLDEVSVLLAVLMNLQQLIDEYEGTDHQEAIINGIVVARQQQTISVSVENLSSAIKAWREVILPWKQEYSDLIENASPELDKALQELSSQIIDTFDPEEEAMLIPRLLPLVNTLTALSITDNSNRADATS